MMSRVLMVDNAALFQMLEPSFLRRGAWDIERAGHGVDLVEKARRNPPDLVEKAGKLLENSVADITQRQEKVDDIMRWAEDFPMDFRQRNRRYFRVGQDGKTGCSSPV